MGQPRCSLPPHLVLFTLWWYQLTAYLITTLSSALCPHILTSQFQEPPSCTHSSCTYFTSLHELYQPTHGPYFPTLLLPQLILYTEGEFFTLPKVSHRVWWAVALPIMIGISLAVSVASVDLATGCCGQSISISADIHPARRHHPGINLCSAIIPKPV